MNTNEYLIKHCVIEDHKGYSLKRLCPRMVCNDGFVMSVQASSGHYCNPRVDNAGWYNSVEIGYPSTEEPLIMEYAENEDAPTDTVYGYVPVIVVDAVIEKHGGLKDES